MVQRPVTGESEYDSSSYYSSQPSNLVGVRQPPRKLDKHMLLSTVMMKVNFEKIDESQIELPRDIFVVCYHRRFIKRTGSVFAQYVP